MRIPTFFSNKWKIDLYSTNKPFSHSPVTFTAENRPIAVESRRVDRKLIIQCVIEIVKKTFHYLNALSTAAYTILQHS